MVKYCCVPGCTNNIKIPGISFHQFPKDKQMRKLWINKVGRDQPHTRPVSSSMHVCSFHFEPSDYKEIINGTNKCLKKEAFPTVFAPRKIKLSRKRIIRELQDRSVKIRPKPETSTSAIEDSAVSDPALSSGGLLKGLLLKPDVQDAEIANYVTVNINEAPAENPNYVTVNIKEAPAENPNYVTVNMNEASVENPNYVTVNMNEASAENPNYVTVNINDAPVIDLQEKCQEHIRTIDELNVKLKELQERLDVSERKKIVLEAVIDGLNKNLISVNKLLYEKSIECETKAFSRAAQQDFNMTDVSGTPVLLAYYTGFDSLEVYNSFHDFINPERKVSYSSKLSEDNQMLLVLSKLRQGFDDTDLSFRFNISTQLVSFIFTSWINDMYYRLACLNIWPHRDVIFNNSPPVFKERYPTCLIILDVAEMKIECPSLLITNSQSCSSYKSSNTVKGLVGCDPKGGIMFISQLYSGSISDEKMTEESGFYDCLGRKLANKEILPGDVVMFNKGLDILKEVEELGLILNVPPTANTEQFAEEELYGTKKIASYRANVERAIKRVKKFKILSSGVIPVTLLPHLNQLWTLCCILTGFSCDTKTITG